MKNMGIIIYILMAIFFVLIKIAMITNESYKNDKIKNLLMVEIAWGAKDVYFIEKKDEKRTPTCKEWDQEYEFKAIYPNEMELGTICIMKNWLVLEIQCNFINKSKRVM